MDSTLQPPPLPLAHGRALGLLSDPDVKLGELARVIESDPALTAAVLRAANSAMSAPIQRVDTANTAIMRVGLAVTQQIVVGTVASGAFEDLRVAGIDAGELWRHLLAAALLAQAIVWTGSGANPRSSQAFTAGILHDLGRLSMAAQEPDRYALVVQLARCGAEVRDAELRTFGFDHAEWGGQVAEAWSIPPSVAAAVSRHHGDGEEGSEAAGGEGRLLAEAVREARHVAASLGIGDGVMPSAEPTFPLSPEHEQLVSRLGGPDGLQAQIDWYRETLIAA